MGGYQSAPVTHSLQVLSICSMIFLSYHLLIYLKVTGDHFKFSCLNYNSLTLQNTLKIYILMYHDKILDARLIISDLDLHFRVRDRHLEFSFINCNCSRYLQIYTLIHDKILDVSFINDLDQHLTAMYIDLEFLFFDNHSVHDISSKMFSWPKKNIGCDHS